MMPVIRISDDVMDILKKFAVPFEDTPDSVLRKILKDYTRMKEIGNQGNRMSSQDTIENLRLSLPREIPSNKFPRRTSTIERGARWIVAALENLGGSARAEEVTNYIQKVFGQEFTGRDRETISSGETRWIKNVHWARYDMTRGGLLNENAPRGVWELTEKGRTFYKN